MEKPGRALQMKPIITGRIIINCSYDQRINQKVTFNTALFYTKGKGYYEEYKADRIIQNIIYPILSRAQIQLILLILYASLWLNNDFYGNIFSVQYKDNKTQATLGGGYHPLHRRIIMAILTWASNGLTGPNRWYDLDALKTDFNIYLKEQTKFADQLELFL